ncbi:unnamed protein product [Rotaria sordida]|uniref:MULE transposase domain-containing protein n=1 Tax=Rotaria sordida TaxID=392033 RepID=A0A814DZB3_9BILA|nr:unnamed protein product [Rotaria sordida]CAF0984881.1 unnamed protein product [Rotaria sordida]CAF1019160.1 unnamed protein product [Rotaria sordida]CAF3572874.1 unnamed protein product [Rotaria sordida]
MAQSQSVAHYISDSENDIDKEIQPSGNTETVKRKKQNRRKWVPLCTYNDKDDIINKINNDSIWSKTHTNITSEGKRVYYRCNQVKWRGKQCPASIHLLYHSENECITMYKSEDDHLHQESRSIGINQQSKEVICELFKMKIKPKRMLELLEEKGLPVPKKQQLSNYLTSLREKCYDGINNDDDDDDNVSNDDDDKNNFRFFVTTKRLLFNASISNKIHVDATYKLIWQGFPCFIIGTTDIIKQFHPYGFAVCSNEKEKDFEFIFSYICDGLRNLNLQMNEQELVLIHMRKRVEKKLNLVEDKALHDEIMNDVEALYL